MIALAGVTVMTATHHANTIRGVDNVIAAQTLITNIILTLCTLAIEVF